MFRKLFLIPAAASLAAAPIAAQAAAPARLPSPVGQNSEQIVGLLWQYLILPVIVAAVLAAITGGDDDPVSP